MPFKVCLNCGKQVRVVDQRCWNCNEAAFSSTLVPGTAGEPAVMNRVQNAPPAPGGTSSAWKWGLGILGVVVLVYAATGPSKKEALSPEELAASEQDALRTEKDPLAFDINFHRFKGSGSPDIIARHDSVHSRVVDTRLDSMFTAVERGLGTIAEYQAQLLYPPYTGAQEARLLKLSARKNSLLAKERAAAERAQEAATIALRRKFASAYENELLDKGFNVDVTTEGRNATTLRLKWILVSKVIAHQFDKGGVVPEMRKLGFKKFILTDGYDETWTWDLTR